MNQLDAGSYSKVDQASEPQPVLGLCGRISMSDDRGCTGHYIRLVSLRGEGVLSKGTPRA